MPWGYHADGYGYGLMKEEEASSEAALKGEATRKGMN
jgi:hypothetical protein